MLHSKDVVPGPKTCLRSQVPWGHVDDHESIRQSPSAQGGTGN